ncbi:peptidylprolyl isomerase [Planctopirus hydrillae]|uniref:PpiC domain-containing protein n=1 Tax=Planctopirus hydrillae TaxID=1841610 RepID=A0A1C3EDP4_9PLAN|nr:peptidylprolyl isomerase [Planctopirus hydrillae]ODA31330.1 hypothetical protein A6X21_05180 [Planctopirus hydrillae]
MPSLHSFPRLAMPPAQSQSDFSQKTSLGTSPKQHTQKLFQTTAVLWVGFCLTLALGELPDNGRTAFASEQESRATSVGKQTPLHQVIVRRVNGRPISLAQLEFLRISRGITDQDAAAAHKSLTETLVDNELIREFLARQKVTVADADIARRKEQFIQQWKNFGYDLPTITKSWGLAEPAWTADITTPLAWYVYSQSQINDAAIAAEFKRQPKRWNGTRLRARQLFLKWPAGQPDAATREKMAEIKARIQAGQLSMEAAIRQFSESPSASQGGDVGWFGYRGRLPAAVSRAAYLQQVGELGQPVESPLGLHLIEVTDIRPGELGIEDARKEIFDELSQTRWNEIVAKGRESATIE